MMEEFKKLLLKKLEEQGGPKKDEKMKAKADMSKELSDTLGEDIFKNLKPDHLKKITVASNSEEGLKEGLDKAEDILKERSHTIGGDEADEKENEEESQEDEASESEDSDEIESKIAELEKQLQELKAKKA